ncbi:hypothetical protein CJF32_00008422 [Rutstroemia sp. NJR-2017a WRK4]|nr:hypothetical protein CJF32_00008422 [Rutstroemia sp. NJR-2017a WRK4]
MSIFSRIKKSKNAAKQHKEQVAADQDHQKKVEEAITKVPYKHVPTHAAIDALSGAPSSWKNEDRPRIREQHKRRSQMTISRTSSAISNMSYINTTPMEAPPLPRNSSYSSCNPTWNDRGDASYLNETISQHKRQKPSKGHSYTDSGIGRSPLSSNINSENESSLPSSGTSTSSSADSLKMAIIKAPPKLQERGSYLSYKPQPTVFGDADIFAHLHTSTSRKVGEAPTCESPPPLVPKIPESILAAEEAKQRKKWSLMGKHTPGAVAV